MTVSELVDYIILLGALCAAIYKIYDFFATPTSKIKQRAQEKEKARIRAIVNEIMPQILYNHDLETREKYKNDRQNYLNEIKEEILQEIGNDISSNTQTIDALVISAKDVLREKIMAIYHKNKKDRTLTYHEKEALDQYYKDYKAINGNSYIDKYYARMKTWEVIDDDYDENNAL